MTDLTCKLLPFLVCGVGVILLVWNLAEFFAEIRMIKRIRKYRDSISGDSMNNHIARIAISNAMLFSMGAKDVDVVGVDYGRYDPHEEKCFCTSCIGKRVLESQLSAEQMYRQWFGKEPPKREDDA